MSAVAERTRQFGDLLFKRATGAAEEMESAKAVCRILGPVYAPGMSLLDVGCGAGHYLRSLRRRVDPEIHYRGVDLTEHYIELAKKAFPGEDLFETGDAFDLPYADGAFDIVLCANVLPNLPPPPQRAMQELIRVAGRLIIIRALFADMTYIVREQHLPDDDSFLYNNMYPEAYYRDVIEAADPVIEIDIQSDASWQPFDNRTDLGAGSTRADNGRQIAGQLVLDWRFITLTKAGR